MFGQIRDTFAACDVRYDSTFDVSFLGFETGVVNALRKHVKSETYTVCDGPRTCARLGEND